MAAIVEIKLTKSIDFKKPRIGEKMRIRIE